MNLKQLKALCNYFITHRLLRKENMFTSRMHTYTVFVSFLRHSLFWLPMTNRCAYEQCKFQAHARFALFINETCLRCFFTRSHVWVCAKFVLLCMKRSINNKNERRKQHTFVSALHINLFSEIIAVTFAICLCLWINFVLYCW